MKVKLISHSMSANQELIDNNITKISDLVCYCARVSNPTNQMNVKTNDKLIKYLLKHKHFSPFEMVNICIEIETTRDIARQILRHRSFSFQEFSQRYSNINEFGDSFVLREARLQDTNNRQNSIELGTEEGELQRNWEIQQQNVIKAASAAYDWAIANNIAKEQSRVVLPEGLTKSVMQMNGTLRSWIHYLDLRIEEGTQKEHREIAGYCAQVINTIFPIDQL